MSQVQSSSQAAGQSGEQKVTLGQKLLFLGSRPAGPTWDPKVKRFQTWWLVRLLIALVIAITAAVLYWVITQSITPVEVKPLPVGIDLALVLAPVLAAAAGIERFLETIFSIIEGNWRTLVAYLGRGMRWLQNAESEVEGARQWLVEVSAEYTRQLEELSLKKLESSVATQPGRPASPSVGAAAPAANVTGGSPNPLASVAQAPQQILDLAKSKLDTAKELMELAEKRLKIAEDQMSQVTSSDGYRNAKRAASIYLGLLLGLIVATVSSLQMFALMGVKVGHPRIDVIITGLVIGSGAAPVHSLINILQATKDTLDGAQGWLKSAQKKPAA